MTQSQKSSSGSKPRGEGSASDTTRESSNASSQKGMGNQSSSAGNGPAEIASQAQEQAGQMVGQAREQATTQLATQKERAASTLGTVASALHEASQQLRERDDAMMAGYIDTAASQVDRLADVLQQQDLGQLIDSTGRFARRQPAVFLAAAIAIGFAGARFLRSSSQPSGQKLESSGSGMSRDQFSGYGSGYSASGMESGLGYGSSLSGTDPAGYADAAGAGRGDDWQARSSFDSGPEGQ